jgi:hypothetical protein
MDVSQHHQLRVQLTDNASPPPIHGSRRRSSLPPSVAADLRPHKRSANYIRTQTTSPEIINNLLDSLSAISYSAYNHFENLPTASGGSASGPATPITDTHPHFGHSLAVPNGSITDSSEQYELFADDACEPPVIRTSKPPSGLSPLTAPKKKDKDNSLKSYLSRSGGSSVSIHSAHSGRSANSFGSISIEAGVPRRVSEGASRDSFENKRSSRAHRGLMYMSSRERLKAKDADRKRVSLQDTETMTSPTEAPRKPTPQHFATEDTIKEEPVIAESSREAQRHSSGSANSLRNGFNLMGPEGQSPTEKGLIPTRGSSLRHSGSPSRKGRRGHSRKGSRNDSYKTNTVPEEDENVDQETVAKEKILKELEAEENEVAHRIRELKKQKMLRDKVAGKRPVGVDDLGTGASSRAAQVSPAATSEPSPSSTVSSMSELRAQDPAKAHKVLGITMHPTPPERRVSREPETTEIRETRETPKSQGSHTRTRSLTVNDGDDITPLPINYNLAMQTFERAVSITSSRPPSNSSSKDTILSASPPARSKSVAVGGRSAASRKSSFSMIMGASTVQATTGSTNDAPSERSQRSASEEAAPRHHSMAILPSSSSASALHSLQNRPKQKKRWSHPGKSSCHCARRGIVNKNISDLPAKAEKQHNDKVDAKDRAAAVQSPPRPIIEERPLSIDSIDVEVDSYLNSQRLSQKLRHPQTGRVISFSEVGDPNGFAVFVCVGMGLTRYVMAFYDQLAVSLKLRLITPDRPGIGASQVDPNGTPLSWPGKILMRSVHLRSCANSIKMMCL